MQVLMYVNNASFNIKIIHLSILHLIYSKCFLNPCQIMSLYKYSYLIPILWRIWRCVLKFLCNQTPSLFFCSSKIHFFFESLLQHATQKLAAMCHGEHTAGFTNTKKEEEAEYAFCWTWRGEAEDSRSKKIGRITFP